MSDDATDMGNKAALARYCLGMGHPKDHEAQRVEEAKTIKVAAISRVLDKAMEGDVAALDWLERHGFTKWDKPI